MKEQEGEELKSANKNKNLPEKKEVTKSTEEMQSKNNLKNKAALKGISQDLLNKVFTEVFACLVRLILISALKMKS